MAPSIFYKILMDPSAPYLPLPLDYINHFKYTGPVILSARGGYSWRLKIKKIGNTCCFTDGWNNVVENIKLEFSDVLLFQHVDRSTFDMSIFGTNGFEKLLPPKVQHDDGGSVDDEENEDVDDPSFELVIRKTNKRVLRFPSEFSESIGLHGEGKMTLKNLEGKEWLTTLRWKIAGRTSRYYLSVGWRKFWPANDLLEGDKCVFRFIRSEGKLLLEKVTKKEAM